MPPPPVKKIAPNQTVPLCFTKKNLLVNQQKKSIFKLVWKCCKQNNDN